MPYPFPERPEPPKPTENDPQVNILAELCQRLVMAAASRNMLSGAEALGLLIAIFLEIFQVHKRSDADMKGVPARAGAVEAMQTAAALLREQPMMQTLSRVNPEALDISAVQCAFLYALAKSFLAAHDHVVSVAGPLSKDAVGDVRVVAKMLRPQVEASLQMALKADQMFTYLQEPYDRAVLRRRGNEKRDAETDKKAEERIGAEARTDARAEAANKAIDTVRLLLGDKK